MLTIYPHAVTHKHISVNFVSYHNQRGSVRKLSHSAYIPILWFVRKEKFFKRIAVTLCWDTKLSYNHFASSSHFWSLCC